VTSPHDRRAALDQMRWVPVWNADSVTLNAGAVVEIVSLAQPDTGNIIQAVQRPQTNSKPDVLVIGPQGLEPGSLVSGVPVGPFGLASDSNLVVAQVTGQHAVGDLIGAVSGAQEFAANQTGWFYEGDLGGGLARVLKGASAVAAQRTEIIEFTIDSVAGTMGSKVATVTIKSRPCLMLAVSEEVDGKVDVYDPSLCWFEESNANLVGRWGWAGYQDPDPPGGDCQWRCFALCCPAC